MLRTLPVVLVLAVLSIAFAAPAHAVLITVNFLAEDAVGGDAITGSFSFDSALIPSGGGTVGSTAGSTDYASSISATDVLGQTWNSTNAGVNFLTFDSNQVLTGWQLAGEANGLGSYLVFGGSPDLILATPNTFRTTTGFNSYAIAEPVQWSFSPQPPYPTSSAPEPASWLLLGGALVGLVGARRRVRK